MLDGKNLMFILIVNKSFCVEVGEISFVEENDVHDLFVCSSDYKFEHSLVSFYLCQTNANDSC